MSGENTTVNGLTNTAAATTDNFLKESAANVTGNSSGTQIANMVFSVTATGITVASGALISSTGGNFTLGGGIALATNAATGFVMVPSCAGTPSGAVTGSAAGNIPMIVDTTGFNIYFLMPSGVWKKAALT